MSVRCDDDPTAPPRSLTMLIDDDDDHAISLRCLAAFMRLRSRFLDPGTTALRMVVTARTVHDLFWPFAWSHADALLYLVAFCIVRKVHLGRYCTAVSLLALIWFTVGEMPRGCIILLCSLECMRPTH